jgi:hypothetical protein
LLQSQLFTMDTVENINVAINLAAFAIAILLVRRSFKLSESNTFWTPAQLMDAINGLDDYGCPNDIKISKIGALEHGILLFKSLLKKKFCIELDQCQTTGTPSFLDLCASEYNFKLKFLGDNAWSASSKTIIGVAQLTARIKEVRDMLLQKIHFSSPFKVQSDIHTGAGIPFFCTFCVFSESLHFPLNNSDNI